MHISSKVLLLLCLTAASSHAASLTIDNRNPYFVDGVQDTTPDHYSIGSVDKIASTRFYDSNKGAEWVDYYSDGTTPMDSLMCWSHAAANSIEYWQSYYGTFYTGTRELPQGKIGTESVNTYEYDAAAGGYIFVDTPNSKQLGVAKAFYDNWDNQGGRFSSAADWYFKWDSASSNGGYYSNYFGDANSTRNSYITVYSESALGISGTADNMSAGYNAFSDTLAGLKSALTPAFGLTANADGSYTQTQVGLLPFIGIWYDVAQADGSTLSYGHMLNCYGFTTDANGTLKTLLLTNPDDALSQWQNVYVKEENGKLMLYTNEAGTLHFLSNNWYLGEVSYINTPELLQEMYAEYSDTNNDLVWNGGGDGTWQSLGNESNTIPDEASGWDVKVDGSLYHSHATEGQNVRFDSQGGGGNITISGTVSPGEIEIAETDYRFVAGENAEIAGEGDVTIRKGAKLSSEVAFGSRAIKVEAEAEFCYERNTDTEASSITGAAGSTVRFRNASETGAIIYTATDMSGVQGHLHIGAVDDAYATYLETTGNLNVQGLILAGSSALSTDGVVKVSGELKSLAGIRAASTFSLRSAVQTPTVDADLDLTETTAYTVEQAISLNGHTLILSDTNSIALTLPYELGEEESFTLFENIGALTINGEVIDQTTTFKAEDFFTGNFINSDMQLIYTQTAPNVGSLSLYSIPEPGTASLSMLALVGLMMRRRRNS